ncbi:trypsin-like serine protease [Vibrio splendidus]|uniref:Trypsin n=1 Tax=Vibrio splendidus TaxID=29497 RepID=A0A2N7JMH4_VIBSP|nr:trypsin-like serine protease [Vibrio splendidus]PMM42867.1 trypsin [Vibrio splendidus]
MKKTCVGLSLSLLSVSVFAVENGTTVDWQNDFDDMVKSRCTGLVVGGNQILTALHCSDLTDITFVNGDVVTASARADHPDYVWGGSGSSYDVSVWTLPQAAKTQNIHYFADLNVQNVSIGDEAQAYGFGGDYPLSYATLLIDKLTAHLTEYQGNAVTGNNIGGDSGGVWMKDGLIVAINQAIGALTTYGTDLHYAKDFLLEEINGWHYPTVLKGTGTQTIKVQSLHQNAVVDAAYVAGDVAITGGTCQTLLTINAFDTCTYELDVTGSGQLHLTTNEVIDINPVTQSTSSSGGSSGGSLGFLSLLGLALFGRLRQK